MVDGFEGELVRAFLMPGKGAFCSVDPDVQAILFPIGDLGGVEDALGPALVANEEVAVVVERVSGNETGELGAELFDGKPGDVAPEVFGMGADIGHAVGDTGHGGIGPPAGEALFLSERPRGMALWVFGDDLQDLADFAGTNELARLLDHRVAGVVVREGKDLPAFQDAAAEGAGLLQVLTKRLVADDVEAGLEEGGSNLEMGIISRDDGNEVDAFVRRKLGFLRRHFGVGAVDAIRVEVEILA